MLSGIYVLNAWTLILNSNHKVVQFEKSRFIKHKRNIAPDTFSTVQTTLHCKSKIKY